MKRTSWAIALVAAVVLSLATIRHGRRPALGMPVAFAQGSGFAGATSSQPLALSADGARLAVINELKKVGTFNPTARNEVRANATAPLGDDGFAPPSLLSVFAFSQTFFHNGQSDSLDAVLNNVTHRSAGTGVDLLTDPEDRRKLVQFLLSIDASTPPIQ